MEGVAAQIDQIHLDAAGVSRMRNGFAKGAAKWLLQSSLIL
jgi:hypothetical protein